MTYRSVIPRPTLYPSISRRYSTASFSSSSSALLTAPPSAILGVVPLLGVPPFVVATPDPLRGIVAPGLPGTTYSSSRAASSAAMR